MLRLSRRSIRERGFFNVCDFNCDLSSGVKLNATLGLRSDSELLEIVCFRKVYAHFTFGDLRLLELN